MPQLLPCGHTDTWQYQVRDKGQRHTYCMKCLFDKVGLNDVYEQKKKTSSTTTRKKKKSTE